MRHIHRSTATTLCLAFAPVVLGCGQANPDSTDTAALGKSSSALLSVQGLPWAKGESIHVCFATRPLRRVDPRNNEVFVTCERQGEDTDCYGEKRVDESRPQKIGSDIVADVCLTLDSTNAPIITPCDSSSTQWRWIRMNGNQGALMKEGSSPGRCLTVTGNGTDDGTKVVLDDCDPSGTNPLPAGQVWERRTDGSLWNPNSTRCLDAPGSEFDKQLEIYNCNGGDNQGWTTKDPADGAGTVKSALNKPYCLKLAADGKTPVATKCGKAPQEWRWIKWDSGSRKGAIMLSTNDFDGKCLEVEGGGTANKTKVVLGNCNWANRADILKAQEWVRQSDNTLMNPQSGRCLDVPAWNVDTQVEIYDCNGGTNQLWDTRNPDSGDLFSTAKDSIHRRVKVAIENSYNRMTNLYLHGWEDCPFHTDDQMVHMEELEDWISVVFQQHFASGAGHEDLDPPNHVHMAYGNSLSWPGFVGNDNANLPIHEFGHNLGFDHELTRPDWPYRVGVGGMFDKGNVFDSGIAPGYFYCIYRNSDDTLSLHDCDSTNVRFDWAKWSDEYPKDETYGGALQVASDDTTKYCLEVTNAGTSNGTLVRLSPCQQGSDGQLWVPDVYGSLKNPHSKKCLDVPGSNPDGKLEIWDCNGQKNQQWNSTNGDTFGTPPDPNSQWQYHVRGTATVKSRIPQPEKCLQPSQSNAAIVGACSTDYDFGWRWEAWDLTDYTGTERRDGTVAGGALMLYRGDAATNQCLTVNGDGKVELSGCDHSAGQLWRPRADKTLYNPGSDQCLDVPHSTPGDQLTIYACDGQKNNQQWDIQEVNQDADPMPLSAWDVVGIHNAYGRKPAGSVVGLNGRCVSIPDPYTGAGQLLQTTHCDGSDRQQWVQDPVTHILAPAYPDSYWDVAGGSLQSDADVEIWSRNDPATPNQQWHFRQVAIRAMGDSCVGVASGAFQDTAMTEIQLCAQNSQQQQWEVVPKGMVAGESVVEIKHGSYCWDVPNGVAEQGRPIQVYGCHGGPNQRFGLTPKGQITFTANDVTLCVDVKGGTPELGAGLQLYPCKADTDITRENQLFYLRGPIEAGNNSGLCLDLPNSDSYEGAPLQISSCNGSGAQEWDYYFGPEVTCSTDVDCEDGDPCTANSCVAGRCESSVAPDGTTCGSDGNECTDDVCHAGTCEHPNNTAPCTDDNNECTDDVCGGGACQHLNNTAPCASDNNSCTNDICSGGECKHESNGSCTPCTGICPNPVNFTWSGSYQSGALGTRAVCRQTTQNWVGGNCGNFVWPRSLYVNGTKMSCDGQNWKSVPDKLNGGYCVYVTPGNQSWAYFTAW
jgi:hypothetical protein